MKKPKTKKIVTFTSSPNIFRDFKCKDPELQHMKSEISIFLHKYKEDKKIGNGTLAKKLGITLKEMKQIFEHPMDVKLKRLLKCLFILGYDSKISITPINTLGLTKVVERKVVH